MDKPAGNNDISFEIFKQSTSPADTYLQYYYNTKDGKFVYIDSILTNIFLTQEKKEEILVLFCKAQKTYRALCRFAFLYKFKKAFTHVSNDLMFDPIDISNGKEKTYIVILQKNFKYIFLLHDIIHLIETAISHSPSFFVDPIYPKNPYNNIEFCSATLYNVYFQMKNSGRVLSTLFHLFFCCDFNTKRFALEYESIIRDHAIKQYIFKSHAVTIYNSIIEMLKSNLYTMKLEIHDEFPKEVLANTFREYLYLCYLIKYGKNEFRALVYNQILETKLKKFYKTNPIFGRRTLHTTYVQCPNTNTLKKKKIWKFITEISTN